METTEACDCLQLDSVHKKRSHNPEAQLYREPREEKTTLGNAQDNIQNVAREKPSKIFTSTL